MAVKGSLERPGNQCVEPGGERVQFVHDFAKEK